MKLQYLFIIILAFTLTGCSKHISPGGLSAEEIQSEKIFQVPNLKKDEIFEKSKMWMPKNTGSVKMVIEYENKKDGIIITNGMVETFLYKNAYPIDVNATFIMQEDIKDGKVRLRIGKVQNTMGIPALLEESKRAIFDQLNALVNDLQRFLMINDKKDDW